MINILHVIRSLGSGGAERQIVDLVKNTQSKSFKHTVCYFTKPNHFADSICSVGGDLICLNENGKRAWLQSSLKLRKVIKQVRPNVIHTWLLDATITARLAAIGGQKIPRVVSLCGPDYEPEVIKSAQWPKSKSAILQWIDCTSGKFSNEFFVACSDYIMESGKLRLAISPNKIKTIYNSIDPQSMESNKDQAQEIRRSLGLSNDAILFINVGRLDPQKGQIFLLRALKQIEAQTPNAYLALVGEGGMEYSLKVLTKELGLEKKVFFLGVRKDIGNCLTAADVFVFPSVFEGFGMALIEAMFLGLPTIAFRVGPIPEIIKNSEMGVLTPPKEINELSKAMLAFYHDKKLRHRIGENGKKHALQRFSSMETIIPAWEKLYRQIAISG